MKKTKNENSKILVIVESPTKVKTIQKYLPDNYEVLASNGHIRDLPESKSQLKEEEKQKYSEILGVDVYDSFKPLYVIPKQKTKIIKELKKALTGCSELILATDEDREGESIAFHLKEALNPSVPVYRVTFNEITKNVIKNAFENKKDIDISLVNAQETRRLLDRLYGYALSALLWKKITYGLSAGRVQSPALKCIVEREIERFSFKSANYHSINTNIKLGNREFECELTYHENSKVASSKDFDSEGKLQKDYILVDDKKANQILKNLENDEFFVSEIKRKEISLSPNPPFITSSLQQEASKLFNFSSKETMEIAQSLYEQGYITYIRTDSYNISESVMPSIRSHIEDEFSKEYLEVEVNKYTSKIKSQEAHEAIRIAYETEIKKPSELLNLNEKERKIYDTIYKRTIACQMKKAKRVVYSISISSKNSNCVFSTSISATLFEGYLKVYGLKADGDIELGFDISDKISREDISLIKCIPHSTKPPQRYSEAKLIEKLEKEGLGRPSTYSTIVLNLLDREYIVKKLGVLIPTFKGFMVYQFLQDNFSNLLEYSFTSKLEENLDMIAVNKFNKTKYLTDFYLGDSGLLTRIKEKEETVKPSKVIKLPFLDDSKELKIGKFGIYFEDKLTEKKFNIPDDFLPDDLQNGIENLIKLSSERRPIANSSQTGNIYYLIGKYGKYLQLENGKNISIPNNIDILSLTQEKIIEIASLPKKLGEIEDKDVELKIGTYGLYIQYEKVYVNIKDINISYQDAVELIKQKKEKIDKLIIKDFGQLRKKDLKILLGKVGPYIKYGKKNIPITKDLKPKASTLTLEEVKNIIKNTK